MLKIRDGIKKKKSRHQRDRSKGGKEEWKEVERNKCSGEKEKGGRRKESRKYPPSG